MTVAIHVGDCIDVLRTLPAESVHCVVTSPPYYGLRDYGTEGQIGLEDSPDAYVAKLVEVFREVRRVLHRTGVCWLNLGDSYAGSQQTGGDGSKTTLTKGGKPHAAYPGMMHSHQRTAPGLKPKDLMMIPARVALALQADGWWLRSQVIWHKPNAMPESVTDRPTTDYECVYLLAKEARYFYDADSIREPHARLWDENNGGSISTGRMSEAGGAMGDMSTHPKGYPLPNPAGRNKRTVWTIPTRPFSQAHFATFPVDLVEPMIRAGTSERGACPECGCQWERVVERQNESNWKERVKNGASGGTLTQGHVTTHGKGVTHDLPARHNVTVGWRPTCDHEADPVPAVCLDPFGGAGTVGLVADRLERDAILIELNEDYAQMAARRIYEDAGMFADVEVRAWGWEAR